MIFGPAVQPAVTPAAAEWIAGSRSGAWGTVGALVPNHYEAYLRVRPPSSEVEDWWAEYRALFDVVATVAATRTATPRRAWFAVWEGYGFDGVARIVARSDRGRAARGRRQLRREQARVRAEDEVRNARTRSALDEIPRVVMPHRTYYLLCGEVAAATQLATPGDPLRWCRPDLWWPDDRRWFVATDVDFWALYIGGDATFTSDVAGAVPTTCDAVTLDRALEAEE